MNSFKRVRALTAHWLPLVAHWLPLITSKCENAYLFIYLFIYLFMYVFY